MNNLFKTFFAISGVALFFYGLIHLSVDEFENNYNVEEEELGT